MVIILVNIMLSLYARGLALPYQKKKKKNDREMKNCQGFNLQ